MKKLYTVLAASLCLSLSADAQRLIDVSTTMTSPTAGAIIVSGVTSVTFSAVIKNLDTDSLKVSDSIFYSYIMDGQVLPINIGGGQTATTFFKTGKKLMLNDTMQLSRTLTLTFPASSNGPKNLCIWAYPANRSADSVKDNMMNNNTGCATVTLTGGVNGINEVTGNAEENVVTNVYPVPATNVANIDIALANKSSVTVRIADLMGRNICVENKGSFNKGQHTISVNTSALPAGLYLYQVIMNEQVSSGKLVIAK